MSLRLIFLIFACGMALAHNDDRLDEQKDASSFGATGSLLLRRSADLPVIRKSVNRREIPEASVMCETDPMTDIRVAADIVEDTDSLHVHKRSLEVNLDNVTPNQCCG